MMELLQIVNCKDLKKKQLAVFELTVVNPHLSEQPQDNFNK